MFLILNNMLWMISELQGEFNFIPSVALNTTFPANPYFLVPQMWCCAVLRGLKNGAIVRSDQGIWPYFFSYK